MPDWSKVKMPLLSAANWGGQGLHPRGNFEGFVRAASRAEVARGARPRALDAFLHRLRRRPAEEVLRPFPQGRGHRLGPSSRRCCCRCATRASTSSSGTRTSGRSRARNGPSSTSMPASHALSTAPPSTAASVTYGGFGDGVTFLTPPLERGDGDHRPDRREAVGVVGDARTPTCSWWCACSRPT